MPKHELECTCKEEGFHVLWEEDVHGGNMSSVWWEVAPSSRCGNGERGVTEWCNDDDDDDIFFWTAVSTSEVLRLCYFILHYRDGYTATVIAAAAAAATTTTTTTTVTATTTTAFTTAATTTTTTDTTTTTTVIATTTTVCVCSVSWQYRTVCRVMRVSDAIHSAASASQATDNHWWRSTHRHTWTKCQYSLHRLSVTGFVIFSARWSVCVQLYTCVWLYTSVSVSVCRCMCVCIL